MMTFKVESLPVYIILLDVDKIPGQSKFLC